jgi:hypothetical protein
MTCLEPDKVDELWPPEIATCRASEDLYVKAFSIEAPQIDLRYVKQALENLEIIMDKLYWNADT